MKNVIIICSIILTSMSYAQNTSSKVEIEKVYTEVTEPATPKLSIKEYYEAIGALIKYSDEAKKANVSGKVYIEFIVEKDGKIGELKVLKGIGYGCDETALNAIKNAGNWNPGKLEGKVVRQKLVIPINFELEEKIKSKF